MSQQEARSQEVLGRCDQRSAIFRHAYVICNEHKIASLSPGLLGLGHMDVHLIAIKVSVERLDTALIKSQSAVLHDLRSEAHYADAVQRRLSVEEDTVSITKMSFHDVPNLKLICDLSFVRKLERNPQRSVYSLVLHFDDKVGTRVLFSAIFDQFPKVLNVVASGPLWVSKDQRHKSGHHNLVNRHIRVRRDHGSAGEINTLSLQVLSKSPVLTLKSLG